MASIAKLVHRSQTVMVPIEHLRFKYNLVRPKDAEEEARIEADILKRGLEKPLETMKGHRPNEVEVLDGELRSRIIEHAHKTKKPIRFIGNGQIIPLGKIPVRGSDIALSETEAWLSSVRYNTGQSMIHPEVMQIALGAHFSKMIEHVKHGDKSKIKEEIAEEFSRTPRWVEMSIQRWEGLNDEKKKEFLSSGDKASKVKPTQLLYASRVKNKEMQDVAVERIEKRKMNEQKALAYTTAMTAATEHFQPKDKADAERISKRVEHEVDEKLKNTGTQPGMQNIADSAFMNGASVTIESVSCVYGNRKISHVPCPRMACPSCGKPIFESTPQPQECEGCGDKGKDLKLAACIAKVKVYAHEDRYREGVLKEAKAFSKPHKEATPKEVPTV